MKKNSALFFLFLSYNSFAQEPEYLRFEQPAIQINHSIFSNMEVADTRFDDVYMGFVQKGAFNRKAPIKLEHPIAEEIQQFAGKLIANGTREDGAVLINIRDFFLSENTGMAAETGTFIFKAACYFRVNDQYNFMFAIDTTIILKSNWDVTKKLEKLAGENLAALIKRAAEFDKSNLKITSYTYADILDIDAKEKAVIPVYNVSLPRKGLYKDFKSFAMNEPSDTSFIEEFNKKSHTPVFYEVKAGNTKGKAILAKNYYAVCDGDQLYFTTNNGIYPAVKRQGDFYFVGKGKDANNTSVGSSAYFMFGILGGLMASIPGEATFEYKIDYSTGKFLPIKKMTN